MSDVEVSQDQLDREERRKKQQRERYKRWYDKKGKEYCKSHYRYIPKPKEQIHIEFLEKRGYTIIAPCEG